MGLVKELKTELRAVTGFTVDAGRVNALAVTVKKNTRRVSSFGWKDPLYWPHQGTDPSEVSQFFAVGNAINFRYWTRGPGAELAYCEGTKGGVQSRGSSYMWRCLLVSRERDTFPILDPRRLARITISEARSIFADDYGHVKMPDIEGRVANLRDLGAKLIKGWDGQFWKLVDASKGSLDKFTDLSAGLRAFDDPLCKLTMVNAIMHEGRGLVKFRGEFLPGIDYHLAKQLVRQGAIRPPEHVQRKLRRYDLLTKAEADGLRRTSLFTLLEIGRKAGVRGDVLDNLYWSNGRRCDDASPVCTLPKRESECPFLNACDKLTEFRIPLELTRYY